jgi:hypothetical protein
MRVMAAVLMSVIVAVSAVACTPTPPTAALSRDDPFRPHREIETDVFRYPTNPGIIAMRLSAEIDRKSAQTTTLLKVHHSYTGRHRNNYESARNAKAELLKLTVVRRYGDCHAKPSCPIEEMYKVEIPEADLRAASATGYALKVFPHTGPDMLITIPREMIASLTALLDKDRGAVAAAHPAPAARKVAR